MEQAETSLKRKRRTLDLRMQMYTVSQLNSANVNLHEAVMKELQELLTDLIIAIEEHVDVFSLNLSQESISSSNS